MILGTGQIFTKIFLPEIKTYINKRKKQEKYFLIKKKENKAYQPTVGIGGNRECKKKQFEIKVTDRG